MVFPHGRESIVSLKEKFDSGKYQFVLLNKETSDLTEITNFKQVISNILEDKGFEVGYDLTNEEIARIREGLAKKPDVSLNYSWKYRDIEIVIHTNDKGEITTPEILCWQEDDSKNRSCYVIGMWEKDSEGWDLRFIGSRPFNVFEDDWGLDIETLWKGIQACQKILNAHFEVTKYV